MSKDKEKVSIQYALTDVIGPGDQLQFIQFTFPKIQTNSSK